MGITINSIECLLAHRHELDFTSTMMLGRQQFFDVQKSRYSELAQRFGISTHLPDDIHYEEGGYADEWFRQLGAKRLEILDASDYEGSTLVHDLNQPLSDEIRTSCAGQMSLVFDAGTLEHIFNVPQALKNISEMIAIEGSYLAILPCNNWGGHGFYQFNPELFYRVFDYNNGFIDTRIWVFNERGPLKVEFWPDPKLLGRRVEFMSQGPVSLFILTKKFAQKTMFDNGYPQQSDYENMLWKQRQKAL